MLKVKKDKEIDKLSAKYHQLTAIRKTRRISFKIPNLLYVVMQERMEQEHISNLSGYYLEVVGFRFYCLYKGYFDAVEAEQKAEKNSLLLDHLPKSTLSAHDLVRVAEYGIHNTPINQRTCPAIFIEVCEHIQKRLGSKESIHLFFRRLTLPLAIGEFWQQIESKIRASEQIEAGGILPITKDWS